MSHSDRDQRGGHVARARRCCDCEYCTHNRRRTRFYGRTRTEGRRIWHRDITREYGQEIRL